MTRHFSAGTLPQPDKAGLAFKNNIFLSTKDYDQFLQENGNRQPVYASIKGFVMMLEPLDLLKEGEFGSNKFQREVLRASMIDKLPIQIKRVTEKVPLSHVDCFVDVLYNNPDLPVDPKGMIKVANEEIREAILTKFSNKFVNCRE